MNTAQRNSTVNDNASPLLMVGVIFLLLLATMMAWIAGTKTSESISELIGAASAPAILTLIVLGIFRLFGKAKTSRSVAKIAMWTLLVMLVGTCANLVNPEAQQAPATQQQE